jgi:arginine decarboxylase
MKFRFPIVIIDEDFRSENTSGLGIRALAQAIESEGFEVLGVTSYGDLSQFAQQQSRASAFILSIDDEEFTPGPDLDPAVLNLRQFIEEVRRKNLDVPIYVYGETKTSRHIPNDILRELHGFIHMFEDTPEFVARHIIREAKSYLEGVQPPFFKALLDYAEDGSYSWHCPGHSGGVAFLKSPVGQMFHQFFGENMLRADVCNAVEELGQLLDHTGPVAERAQCGAHLQRRPLLLRDQRHQHQSNKMVWHHCGGAGRRGGGGPQLPQVHPAQHHHDGAHAGVPEAHAQPLRHHRPDPEGASSSREAIQAKIKRQPAAQGRGCEEGQAARDDADAVHLRRRALQHRDHQGHAGRLRRQPAFRRGLAAARGLPPVLRHLPRHGQEAGAAQAGGGVFHAVDPQAAGRHQPGQPCAGAGRTDGPSWTGTCSTKPT